MGGTSTRAVQLRTWLALLAGIVACTAQRTAQRIVPISLNGPPVYPWADYACPNPRSDTADGVNLEIVVGYRANEDFLVCDRCRDMLILQQPNGKKLALTGRRFVREYLDAVRSVRFASARSTPMSAVEVVVTFVGGACPTDRVRVAIALHDECMGTPEGDQECRRVPFSGRVEVDVFDPKFSCDDMTYHHPCGGCDDNTVRSARLTLDYDQGYTDTLIDDAATLTCDASICDVQRADVPVGYGFDFQTAHFIITQNVGGGMPSTLRTMYSLLNTVRLSFERGDPLGRFAQRRVSWVIAEPGASPWYVPDTGSLYEYIPFSSTPLKGTWLDAQELCAGKMRDQWGMAGFLMTVTERMEGVMAARMAIAMSGAGGLSFWLGGADVGEEGTWRWITGPEGCPPYNTDDNGTQRTSCGVYPLRINTRDGCGGTACASGTTFFEGMVRGTGSATAVPGVYNAFVVGEQPTESTAPDPVVATCAADCGRDYLLWRAPTGGVRPPRIEDRWHSEPMDFAATGAVCEWTPSIHSPVCVELENVMGSVCFIPEGPARCATCVDVDRCGGPPQQCVDPNPSQTALNDWECRCVAPASGTALTRRATCTLDECTTTCAHCLPSPCADGQHCVDPDPSAASTSDWSCECLPPYTGSAPQANATCVHDECVIIPVVCADGQDCIDGAPSAASLNDWSCSCRSPASGTAIASNASCTFDECVADCPTCLAPRACAAYQTCVDVMDGAQSLGDWVCACDLPSTGTAGVATNATCALDECTTTCPTCAPPDACGDYQECVDPVRDVVVRGDWECRCVSPAMGAPATAGPARCSLNECDAARDPCGADQVCSERDVGVPGDFECTCKGAPGLREVGRAADCPPPPATAVPQTAVPPLQVPADAATGAAGAGTAPTTGAPATEAPATADGDGVAVNDTRVPPPPVAAASAVEITGSAVAAVTVVAFGAAGPALRTVVVLGDCMAIGGDNGYPLAFHPTRLEVYGSQAAGAVVGNFWIVAAVAVVMYVIVLVLKTPACGPWLSRFAKGTDPQGLLHFPAVPLALLTVLYPGTTFAAGELVFHAPNAESFLVGVIGASLCAIVPLNLWRVVRRAVPNDAGFQADPRKFNPLWQWLLGPGDWVSWNRGYHWANRYVSAIAPYRQRTAWFLAVDQVVSGTISAIGSTRARSADGCAWAKLGMGVVLAIMLAVELIMQPHCRGRNNDIDAATYLLQSAAAFLFAAGYLSEDETHVGFDIAGYLLLTAIVITAIRAALDLVALLYDIKVGRHVHLQEKCFAIQYVRKPDVDPSDAEDKPTSPADPGAGSAEDTAFVFPLTFAGAGKRTDGLSPCEGSTCLYGVDASENIVHSVRDLTDVLQDSAFAIISPMESDALHAAVRKGPGASSPEGSSGEDPAGGKSGMTSATMDLLRTTTILSSSRFSAFGSKGGGFASTAAGARSSPKFSGPSGQLFRSETPMSRPSRHASSLRSSPVVPSAVIPGLTLTRVSLPHPLETSTTSPAPDPLALGSVQQQRQWRSSNPNPLLGSMGASSTPAPMLGGSVGNTARLVDSMRLSAGALTASKGRPSSVLRSGSGKENGTGHATPTHGPGNGSFLDAAAVFSGGSAAKRAGSPVLTPRLRGDGGAQSTRCDAVLDGGAIDGSADAPTRRARSTAPPATRIVPKTTAPDAAPAGAVHTPPPVALPSHVARTDCDPLLAHASVAAGATAGVATALPHVTASSSPLSASRGGGGGGGDLGVNNNRFLSVANVNARRPSIQSVMSVAPLGARGGSDVDMDASDGDGESGETSGVWGGMSQRSTASEISALLGVGAGSPSERRRKATNLPWRAKPSADGSFSRSFLSSPRTPSATLRLRDTASANDSILADLSALPAAAGTSGPRLSPHDPLVPQPSPQPSPRSAVRRMTIRLGGVSPNPATMSTTAL